MADKKIITKVKWDSTVAEEDVDKNLKRIKVTRTITRTPVTKAGALQYSQRETTEDLTFEIKIDEIPDLIAAAISWLTWFSDRSEW